MKVEVAVLGSPSLVVLMVSVDVKQHQLEQQSSDRSCVKVEVDVFGSLSLILSPYGLCGRKATLKNRVQELCKSLGGHPCTPLPIPSLVVLMVSVDVKQHQLELQSSDRSCVKVEVGVLGPLYLIVLMVYVDVRKATLKNRVQELSESLGGHPGLSPPPPQSLVVLMVSVDVKLH